MHPVWYFTFHQYIALDGTNYFWFGNHGIDIFAQYEWLLIEGFSDLGEQYEFWSNHLKLVFTCASCGLYLIFL